MTIATPTVLSTVERLVNPRFTPRACHHLSAPLLIAIWEARTLALEEPAGRSQTALLGVRVPNAMSMFASGRRQPIENGAASR